MEALYYLCGADRASFTAALSLWLSKHTSEISWVGSQGVDHSDRFVTNYIDLVSSVPEAFALLEKSILAKAQMQLTTREFVEVLDDSGLGRRGADVWRKALGVLPSKGKVLDQRNVTRKKCTDLLGEWHRAERTKEDADGKKVVTEQFWLDPIRELVEAIAPVYIMESLQPPLAPKKLLEELEDKQKQCEVDFGLATSEAKKEEITSTKVKLEKIVRQATRNGSYSRKALDDIIEGSCGTTIHNQVRQVRERLRIYSNWNYDHTNVFATSEKKTAQTGFMFNIINGSLAVNTRDHVFYWAIGDGHDDLDSQESIIEVFNETLRRLREEDHEIQRPTFEGP